MRLQQFLIKFLLFLLPFAIPFVLLTGFLIYTGESMPLAWVVEMQRDDALVLYRPRYGNRDLEYKILATGVRQPELVAVGSSHVLQLRAQLANRDPNSFYNAGAPAWQLEQVEAYLNGITHTPRVLILGMDHPWFNADYIGDPFAQTDVQRNDWEQLFAVNRSFLQDVFAGVPFDSGRYLSREANGGGVGLGLRAIRDGHAFRNDGSEQYGDFLIAGFLSPEGERVRHLQLLANGESMYVRGDAISPEAMAQLTRILDLCAERSIIVIGFLPPFMPSLYDQLVAGGEHQYALSLPVQLQDAFAEHNFAFFDFSDGELLGAADTDFFDGWHASERIYLRLYARMVQALPNVLGAYSEVEALNAIDAAATDTFRVFP